MGGGGGKSTTTSIKADAPDVFSPQAPDRGAPGEMPDNYDQALFTGGAKRTADEKAKANLGTSRLVIPLEGDAQSGGYTAPRTPQGVV